MYRALFKKKTKYESVGMRMTFNKKAGNLVKKAQNIMKRKKNV